MGILLDKMAAWGCDTKGAMERLCGNEMMYDKFIKTVMADEGFISLRNLLTEEKYEEAFAVAHTLKGVTANMGVTPLLQEVSVMVEKLRAKDYTGWEEICEVIEDKYKEFVEIVQSC